MFHWQPLTVSYNEREKEAVAGENEEEEKRQSEKKYWKREIAD